MSKFTKYRIAAPIKWCEGLPEENGRYRAQDYTLQCDCCWMAAEYRNGVFTRNRGGLREVFTATRWAPYPYEGEQM